MSSKNRTTPQAGETLAPKRMGRPPMKPGSFADPGPRGRVLIETYGLDQIQNWYELIKEKRANLVPLSAGDQLLIGRIARASIDGYELDRFHDRSFGKVPDKSINLNVNVDADPEKLSTRAAEMLARLQD